MVMRIKEVKPLDESEPDPPFGAWTACRDGRAHYVLAGERLCGASAAATGAPVRASGQGNWPILVPYCAACVAANEDRWAREGR
jgi:hypothetical protein